MRVVSDVSARVPGNVRNRGGRVGGGQGAAHLEHCCKRRADAQRRCRIYAEESDVVTYTARSHCAEAEHARL